MNETYIYGRNAIIEALLSETEIEKIYIHFNSTGAVIDKITHLARKAKVPVVKYDKSKFSVLERNISDTEIKTQGVIAQRALVQYWDLNGLIKKSLTDEKNPVLVLVDEINDPHNLGAIARSAECAGAYGLIIPERNSSPVTPATIKTSAGAISHLPLAKTGSIINTLQKLKDSGFWIVATDMDGDKLYTDDIYDSPIVLIIGNEGKGITPAVLKHCDFKVKIQMSGKINSLNASVSAGVVLFEIMRQRRNKLV